MQFTMILYGWRGRFFFKQWSIWYLTCNTVCILYQLHLATRRRNFSLSSNWSVFTRLRGSLVVRQQCGKFEFLFLHNISNISIFQTLYKPLKSSCIGNITRHRFNVQLTKIINNLLKNNSKLQYTISEKDIDLCIYQERFSQLIFCPLRVYLLGLAMNM